MVWEKRCCDCSFVPLKLLALLGILILVSFSPFQVETCTGSLSPASFDGTSRCPDEIVRRIRVTSSYEDTSWNGKLLETYDTQTDRFVIAPCRW